MSAATPPVLNTADLAGMIPSGAKIAVPPDYSGCAMALVNHLMRRPVRDLHIVAVPQAGFQVDQLIGAGCVARVEAAAVTLGEYGLAPRFTAAIRAGTIEMWDATCPAIQSALQASEKGIPFMPHRGIIGSDLLKVRPDWLVIDNPFAENGRRDPIVLLPAIRPDFAVFHAVKADRNGNVWIGIRRELMLMAHASKETVVTVEEIVDTDFLADPALAAGTIPSIYISAIAHEPQGAAPLGITGVYPSKPEELRAYAQAARTDDGFAGWFEAHVARERELA